MWAPCSRQTMSHHMSPAPSPLLEPLQCTGPPRSAARHACSCGAMQWCALAHPPCALASLGLTAHPGLCAAPMHAAVPCIQPLLSTPAMRPRPFLGPRPCTRQPRSSTPCMHTHAVPMRCHAIVLHRHQPCALASAVHTDLKSDISPRTDKGGPQGHESGPRDPHTAHDLKS